MVPAALVAVTEVGLLGVVGLVLLELREGEAPVSRNAQTGAQPILRMGGIQLEAVLLVRSGYPVLAASAALLPTSLQAEGEEQRTSSGLQEQLHLVGAYGSPPVNYTRYFVSMGVPSAASILCLHSPAVAVVPQV